MVKSPRAAWEGRLGKGSGGFCAGGGRGWGRTCLGSWDTEDTVVAVGSEQGTVQPPQLAVSRLGAPGQPSPGAQHLCVLLFSPRKMIKCKICLS